MKAPKLKCQICGSPKMRKAAVGFVCDQGHVQTVGVQIACWTVALIEARALVSFMFVYRCGQGYIQEDNELQEYTAHYQTVRKVKRPRGPRKPKKSAWVKRGQCTYRVYYSILVITTLATWNILDAPSLLMYICTFGFLLLRTVMFMWLNTGLCYDAHRDRGQLQTIPILPMSTTHTAASDCCSDRAVEAAPGI